MSSIKSKIDIAVGRTAESKHWNNQTTTWEKFVERLKKSVQTNETIAQYLKASKKEQAVIKDVGGYVGGYCIKGSRAINSIGHRQLVTLDIDFGSKDFFVDFQLAFTCAAFLHATHKHCDDAPRYRLIIPLDREVTPDEYGAISRRIAGDLDINIFDPTTFDVNRLMFWPSNPKDVPYYWEEQKGEFLCADDVLAQYADWKDISLWPCVESRSVKDPFGTNKQEDPFLKKGVVGAFCRTYGIAEAIEKFIPTIYIPAGPDRYTYAGGSTSGGVIVYDDLFTYSHHGTDPAGGRTCNAFDLIRIHLYKDLDKNEDSNASFKAMESLCTEDKAVKFTMAKEKLGDKAEEKAEDLEWMSDLEMDSKGTFLSTSNNVDAILKNDKHLKDLFSYNEFDTKRYIMRSPTWREITEPEPVRNVDYAGVRNYLETIYGINSAMKVDDSLSLEIERNTIHPIRTYLNGLEWDGEKRIETVLMEYFGAADNEFTREAFKKMLVAAVARVMNPGCKFDYMLVLVGSQGIRKSSFLNILGKGWFSDSFSTTQGKEALEQLQGAWIIEIAELSAFRKSDVESIKHFVSKQKDDYRPAYARAPETFKRQCVFFGTTNNLEFLKDPTGNRRFWPILCGTRYAKKDVFTHLPAEVDQLWAEAVHLYNAGEKLYLTKEIEHIALEQQEKHSEKDERMGLILEYLDRRIPKNWDTLDIHDRRNWLENPTNVGEVYRDKVCTAEVWCECLGKSKEDMTRYNTRELNDLLRSLPGWTPTVSTATFTLYGTQKYYERKLY